MRFSVSTTDTKAAIVNNNTLQTVGQSFTLDAWLEEANRKIDTPPDNLTPHYIDSAAISLTGSVWSGTNLYWCDRVFTNFWASYPRENIAGRSGLIWPGTDQYATTDAQQKTPSFTYNMSSYAADNAATTTKDLLIAYARGRWNDIDKEGGIIKIKFEHALSAICYKMGTIDTGCRFTKITISGIQYDGTCSLTGFTSGVRDTVSISWTFPSARPADSLSFSQTISTAVPTGSQLLGDNYIFFIPQAMQSMATISATIELSNSSTETKQVELSGYNWKPGHKYEYTLSYSASKSELEITTTEYELANGLWTD